MNRFCVRCGKQAAVLIESLCPECYLLSHDPLPVEKNVPLDYDVRSGRVRIGRKWVELSDAVVSDAVAGKVLSAAAPKRVPVKDLSVSVEHLKERVLAKASFSIEVNGVVLPFVKEFHVRLNRTISDASMKLSSNYHEAIIQIRFAKRPSLEEGRTKLKEVLGLLLEEKKKIELSEAIDTKNVPGGFDLFVGSSKASKAVARKLEKKYKLKYIYSNKLIGLDRNGKEKYRHTYCVKFD